MQTLGLAHRVRHRRPARPRRAVAAGQRGGDRELPHAPAREGRTRGRNPIIGMLAEHPRRGAARRRHHDRRHAHLLRVDQLHARLRAHGDRHPAAATRCWPTPSPSRTSCACCRSWRCCRTGTGASRRCSRSPIGFVVIAYPAFQLIALGGFWPLLVVELVGVTFLAGLLGQLRGGDGRAVPGRGAQHRHRPAVRARRRDLRRHRPVHHHLDERERAAADSSGSTWRRPRWSGWPSTRRCPRRRGPGARMSPARAGHRRRGRHRARRGGGVRRARRHASPASTPAGRSSDAGDAGRHRRHRALVADLADPSAAPRSSSGRVARAGPVDVLVNAAGHLPGHPARRHDGRRVGSRAGRQRARRRCC